MELALVKSETSMAQVELRGVLGTWATGNWLIDKYFEPDSNFSEVSVDFTTEGFDASKLVRLGELAVEAA